MTREESLEIIRRASGGNTPAANETSQTVQDNTQQQSSGARSREESLRIIQSAMGGGSTAEASPQPSSSQPTTPQTATPSTSSGAYTPPSPQGEGRSAEQIQQEISDSRKRLEQLQSDAAYVLTAEPGAELGRQMDEVRERIKTLNEELNALNRPKTNAERDSLIQRMNDITANEGYATTVELADAVTQEKQDTRQRLHQLDEELGNAARFYDSGERAGAVTKGALKQTGSAYTNFMGTLQGVGNRLNELSPDENAALYGIDYGELEKEEQRLYEKADTTAESAARDIEQAKEGLSALGKAGVDISTNLIQMGIDAAGRAAGLGMLPFFVRAAGGSMQEARQAGASTGQQLAYGLIKGAIEVGTEKLFDGLAGVFGKGAADDVIEGLIGKLSGSNTGRSLLRAFAGAAGEGTEEVISDLLDPFAKLIYNDQALKEAWENRAELRSQMLYDYLLGAAMGGLGSVTGAATGQYAEKNAALAEMDGQSQTEETAAAEETPQSAGPTAPLTGEPLRAATQADGTDYGTIYREEPIPARSAPSLRPVSEQTATTQAETPPTTENAAQAASGELNRQAAEDYSKQTATGKKITAQEGAESTGAVSNEIVRKLRDSIPDIQQEPIVSALNGNEFAKGERKLTEQVGDFFRSLGNRVFRKGFGSVIIDERSVKNDIAHGIGRAKAVTFAAVPDVIASGKQIDFQKNWKGREYNSYVFAAPVKIGDRTSYVAAVVLSDSNNRFYLHEVVDENGNLIYKMKTAPADIKTGVTAESGITGAGEAVSEATASNNSIAQDGEKYNSNFIAPMESDDTAERGFSHNVATDSAMEAALRREFEQNPEMYTRLANKDTLKKAQDIFVMGLDTARSELERAIGAAQSGQKFAPEMVPLSRMVANELTRRGELTAARKIISDVAAELTGAGQLGQAAAILRNADPVTVLNTLQKSIDAINAEVGKKFGKRNAWKAELTAEEIKQISETDFSQDGAFEAIQQQIAERLGREMPATLWEKLTELRRLNMLLRPRTQIKNIVSNVPMAGMRKGAETLSGAIQDALVKSGKMDASEQTRTLKVSQETREMANEVYNQVKDSLSGASDKWDMNTLLRKNRTYFKKGSLQKFLENKGITKEMKTSFLESARRFTYDCLEKGDAPFVKSAFVDSLAQYCGARGINDINNVTTEAIEFATANAMEATFKNANVVAKCLNQIKRNGGPGAAALDILFPFTTTPINITSMMLKYSPAGFADTVLQAVKGANTTDIIDSAAKATVGTAVMCLGYALRNLGLITGGEDEDKDKAAHDKAKGISPYSFLGRISYDWAQPSGGLLALGAEIADAVSGKESFADAVMNAIYTSGDSLLNMSMFQNVLRVLKGTGKPTQQLLDEIIEGGATQLMPGLAGDIAKIIDGTVRSTYTGGNVFDDTWARLTAAIPGLSKTLPESVNVKGEANTRGGLLTRAANTLINPSTVNINKANAVDNALDEVYEATGDKTIFRQVSPYKVDYGGESYQMTGEEREQFQKTQGQVHDDILQQIIDGTLWDKMDNDAKVKTMQLANEYALDAAKRELVESRGDEYSSDWDDEAELPDVDKYLAIKSTATSADVNGKKGMPNFDVIDSILSGPYKNLSADSRDDLDNSYSRLDDMYKASLRGIDSETYYKAYALYKKYQNGSGNSTDRAEDLKTAINGLSGLSQGQKDWLAENLKLTQTMYVDTESMDKLTDAGLTSGNANRLMDDFGGIVPAQGYSGVQAAQKYQAISGASYLSDEDKWKAFFAIATEAAARDARTYWTVGYSYSQWLNSSGYGKVKTK